METSGTKPAAESFTDDEAGTITVRTPFAFEDRNLLSEGENCEGGVAETTEKDSDDGQD